MRTTAHFPALTPILTLFVLLLTINVFAQNKSDQNKNTLPTKGRSATTEKATFRHSILKFGVAALPLESRWEYSVEFERPVSTWINFDLQYASVRLNQSVPFQDPGTYSNTFTEIKTKSLVFFLPIETTTYSEGHPYKGWGDFLPFKVSNVSASYKFFVGEKATYGRFYMQSGLRVYIVNGRTQNIQRHILSKSHQEGDESVLIFGFGDLSIDTTAYKETITVIDGAGKAAFGGFMGLGYQIDLWGKLDLDLRAEFNVRSGQEWRGFEKLQVPLRFLVGYRF